MLKNLQVAVSEAGAVVVEELPTVHGAMKPRILQLFQNLIGNAIKFHRDAAPEVHIWAERDGPAWRFRVADNGIGIEPQYADRIFVIFQRLHTARSIPARASAWRSARRSSSATAGASGSKSSPGVGTTFFFTIPDRQEAALMNNGRLKPIEILMIDDDPGGCGPGPRDLS